MSIKKAQTEAPCILCSGRGVVDFGVLFNCRTPGTYDPCPMCVLREQRDAMVKALKDAHDAISSLPQDCMGDGHDGQLVWPIRDEVLDKIAHALVRGDDER